MARVAGTYWIFRCLSGPGEGPAWLHVEAGRPRPPHAPPDTVWRLHYEDNEGARPT